VRILYFCGDPQESRSEGIGYNVRIAELTRAFEQCGHEVVLLMAGERPVSKRAKRFYRAGVSRFLPIAVARKLRDAYKLISDTELYHRAKFEVQKLAPDFIFHRYTFFCRHGITLGRLIEKPVILEVEACVDHEEKERPYLGLGLKSVAQAIEKQVFRNAAAIIVVSRALRDHLSSLGLPAEKIHVIPNAVDCEKFDPKFGGDKIRNKYGLGNKKIIGYIGNFDPYHGVNTLVEVTTEIIAERDDAHLLLVGDGLTRASLEDHVRKDESLTRHVTFAGKVDHEDLPGYVGAFDVGVLPNSNSYGSPMKIFEYMAMAKPTVAPRLPPVEEILTHNRNGLLFEPGSKPELKQALLHMLEDEEVRTRLGAEARKTILQHFTWRRSAERIVRIAAARRSESVVPAAAFGAKFNS